MRKKTKGTIIAAIALVLVGAGLGFRLWANSRLDSMPMFWAVHVAPDGHVLAELDDRLYIENAYGESRGVIPLSRFGVKGFEGDFAILSDDSIILQKGSLPAQNSHDVIRALTRTRHEQPDADTTGAVPLQRCSLKTFQCTTLSGNGNYFKVKHTFKLYVDEDAQRIYIADTDQQRLVMTDLTGKILDTLDGVLQFPNQLQLTAPGELTVVDTNHNRIVTYAVTADGFGKKIKSMPQRDWLGISMNDYYFPTGFVQTADGSQWAVIADNTLSHGMLFRRPADGSDVKKIQLPEGSEFLSLAATQHDVLVPDNANYRIHEIKLDGTPDGDFGSDVLNNALDRYATRHRLYASIFSRSLWIMLLLAVPLLIVAVRLQRAVEDGQDDTAVVAQRKAEAQHDLVDADAVQQNCGSGAAGADMMPALKPISPFEFRRQWGKGKLMNSRFGLLFASLVFLVPLVLLLWIDHLDHLHHPQAPSVFDNWVLLAYPVMAVFLLGFLWSSYTYERVLVNQTGLGYSSLFSGPIAALSFLHPSWALKWNEIASIELRSRGKGWTPNEWFYVIRDKRGTTRRLLALSWILIGQPDGNPCYRANAFYSQERLRSAVYRTALYRLIGRRGQV